MRYAFPLVLLLILAMSTYYVPQFVTAQTEDRCNEQICHVKITKDGFVPTTLIVKIGTKVVWTNTDDGRHTVTSGSAGEIIPPLNSKILNNGDTYEFTFEYGGFYKGRYQYFDQITQFMRGEIIVKPETEKTGTMAGGKTINLDFNDPKSGVKKVSLSSGTIKSMEINTESRTLIINLANVQTDGNLEITLDRNLIDAKSDDTDAHFIVLVKKVSLPENAESYGQISSTPTDRTLQILVPETTTQIKIVGTQVVPEFPIAMLAIASVFSAMIIAYRLRTRL